MHTLMQDTMTEHLKTFCKMIGLGKFRVKVVELVNDGLRRELAIYLDKPFPRPDNGGDIQAVIDEFVNDIKQSELITDMAKAYQKEICELEGLLRETKEELAQYKAHFNLAYELTHGEKRNTHVFKHNTNKTNLH